MGTIFAYMYIPSFQHPLKPTAAILRFFRYPEERLTLHWGSIENLEEVRHNLWPAMLPYTNHRSVAKLSSPHIKPNVFLLRSSVWRAFLSSLSYVKKKTTTNYKQLLNSLTKINMFGKSNVKPWSCKRPQNLLNQDCFDARASVE